VNIISSLENMSATKGSCLCGEITYEFTGMFSFFPCLFFDEVAISHRGIGDMMLHKAFVPFMHIH